MGIHPPRRGAFGSGRRVCAVPLVIWASTRPATRRWNALHPRLREEARASTHYQHCDIAGGSHRSGLAALDAEDHLRAPMRREPLEPLHHLSLLLPREKRVVGVGPRVLSASDDLA